MATLITPSVIASSALATLYNTTVLLPLVNRDYDSDFQGKQGDTITVRTPASFIVDEFDRAEGIQLQDPTEGSFTVTLDKLLDVSFPITAEELTLELSSFETQLLNPATEAISQDVDGRLAEQLVDAANAEGGGGVATAKGTGAGERLAAFRAAKRILSRNKLPFTDRNFVLSPEGAEAVTGDPTLLQANTSGSTEALREGAVGRLSGMNGYESQTFGLGSGDKGQADGVAFHRSAVAAVTRTLVKPMGVADAQVSVQNYKGLGLRVVRDYDVDKKQDVISIDTLFGASTVRKQAAVELDFGQGS
jgi:hypothetical protein